MIVESAFAAPETAKAGPIPMPSRAARTHASTPMIGSKATIIRKPMGTIMGRPMSAWAGAGTQTSRRSRVDNRPMLRIAE